MPKRCVAYLRVSTAEQAAPGHHSLDAQEILCRRYAEANALELIEVIRDEGYSGRTTARPGLRRLIEYTGPQPPVAIATILVQDTSRMGRDTTEYLLFRRQLRERDIELVAVTQPNIDGSPEGRLVDTILAGINQYQSEEKGRRVAIALQKKFEEGWWPAWAPLGYLNAAHDTGRLVIPDPIAFPLIQLAFREYATGRYAQENLCHVLSEKGLRNRLGKPVTRTTLNYVLANPFYWGLMRWHGQERMGKHDPATDRLTFDRCQAVTQDHNRYAPRSRKHKFLLTGLTRCDECGHHHTHSVVKAKGKRYYHCKSRAHCQQPYVAQEDLENQVARAISGIRLTEEFIERVVRKVADVYADERAAHESQRSVVLRRQSLLEQQRGALEEKVLSGVLSDEAYRRHMPRIASELDEVRRGLKVLDIHRGFDSEKLRHILLFARDIPEAYAKAPERLKRQYLEFFFEELVVRDKRVIRTKYTELFRMLLEGENGSNLALIAPLVEHYSNLIRLVILPFAQNSASVLPQQQCLVLS